MTFRAETPPFSVFPPPECELAFLELNIEQVQKFFGVAYIHDVFLTYPRPLLCLRRDDLELVSGSCPRKRIDAALRLDSHFSIRAKLPCDVGQAVAYVSSYSPASLRSFW